MSRMHQNVTDQNTTDKDAVEHIGDSSAEASAPTIPLTINGQSYRIPAKAAMAKGKKGGDLYSLSLAEVIGFFNLDPAAVAIEHNGIIIPFSQHSNSDVYENDAVEIVGFIGGG